MAQNKAGSVRLIGGQWRGRRLPVADIPGLRPTPDRVRETLFNWLQLTIQDAVCLDLFAGSGALGFEALSRGAKHVVMVDQATTVIQQLRANVSLLQAVNVDIMNADVANTWPRFDKQFSLVFLDPPFQANLLTRVFEKIADCLLPEALIYVEMDKSDTLPALPEGWVVMKEKQAGNVAFYLLQAVNQRGKTNEDEVL